MTDFNPQEFLHREFELADVGDLLEVYWEGHTRARLLHSLGDPIGASNMQRATEPLRKTITNLIEQHLQ